MSGGRYGRGKAPERACQPVDRWPEEDARLWGAACRPGSPLDDDLGARSRHAQITNEKDRKGYGRWLTHLRFNDSDALLLEPSNRITPITVPGYVQRLRSLGASSATILARLQELGAASRV